MNIALSGGSGFIGKHLMRLLADKGHNLIEVVYLNDLSKSEMFSKNIKKILWDGTRFSGLEKLDEVEYLIHLATDYGHDGNFFNVFNANLQFPINLIQQLSTRNLKVIINTDSFFTKFPDYAYLPQYVQSKRFFASILKQFYTDRYTIFNLQLEHVYGPGDNMNKFVPQIVSRLFNNDPEIELTSGMQKRDFVYIRDIIRLYEIILHSGNKMGNGYYHFEVGRGEAISIKSFVETAKKQAHATSDLQFGNLTHRENEIETSKADLSWTKMLPWKAETDISEGISAILETMAE